MSDKNQQKEEEARELTPEERAAKREELKKFYESSIPQLESQLKYEELLTKIDAQRFERFKMQFQMASAMAPPPGDEDAGDNPPPSSGDEKPKRPLKKEGN